MKREKYSELLFHRNLKIIIEQFHLDAESTEYIRVDVKSKRKQGLFKILRLCFDLVNVAGYESESVCYNWTADRIIVNYKNQLIAQWKHYQIILTWFVFLTVTRNMYDKH